MVQNCALTEVRDFGGKLECLLTVILIICVFSMTTPTKEAKLQYVDMLVNIFFVILVGTDF